MATNTTKKVYTDAEREEGRKTFAVLETWGNKGDREASVNMIYAGILAMYRRLKNNALRYNDYQRAMDLDSKISDINAEKLAHQELVTARFKASQS
jgi:uncharacterized protein (DUF2225 family)